MSHRSFPRKLGLFIIFFIFIFCVFQLNFCDGFRLRDLTESGNENKLSLRKFRDIPFKKVTKFSHLDDEDGDDDDFDNNNRLENNDDTDIEDDDDDEVEEVSKKYVFQKVRRQKKFDLPKQIKKNKNKLKKDTKIYDDNKTDDDDDDDDNDDDDNDDDENDDNDDNDFNDDEESLTQTVLNFFGFSDSDDSSDKNDDDDNEQAEPFSISGWFASTFQKQENDVEETADSKLNDADDEESKSWFDQIKSKISDITIFPDSQKESESDEENDKSQDLDSDNDEKSESWISKLKTQITDTFTTRPDIEFSGDKDDEDDIQTDTNEDNWITRLQSKITEITTQKSDEIENDNKDDDEDDDDNIESSKKIIINSKISKLSVPKVISSKESFKKISSSAEIKDNKSTSKDVTLKKDATEFLTLIKNKSSSIIDFISKVDLEKNNNDDQYDDEDDDNDDVKENISIKSEIKEDIKKSSSPLKGHSKERFDFNTSKEKLTKSSIEQKKVEVKPQDKKSTKAKNSISLEEFDDMLLNLPSFVPNYTDIHNSQCKSQGEIFLKQVRGQKHWALQMMDASAKIPAGLMRGNVNQLGDYDLCTEIRTRVKDSNEKLIKIKGKYCLAHVDITAVAEDLKLPVHLMQGRSFLRSSLQDPSHFVPRFTTFNWGICLPSGCNHEDAEKIIRDGVRLYNTTGIKIQIGVNENNCFVKHRTDYVQLLKDNWQISATIAYYTVILVLVVLASMNDYWTDWKSNLVTDKNKTEVAEISEENQGAVNQILMAFSIKRTGKALFGSSSGNGQEIECIHGIKALGTIALYFALKLVPLARVPFTNRIYFTEYFNSPFSVFIRAAFLYTDIFLLISGILTAFKMSKDIEHTGKIPWFKRLFGRIIRLTPALLAVLLFYAWIWEHTGSGPQWGDVVKQNADICKENLWQNLFHIQNWFSFDEICATQTAQLGIDMQFYIISPIIVWLLHSMPVIGLGAFGILHGISAAMRYSSTLTNRLSPVVFHGMKLTQFYRTADLSFAAPLHRATPYFTGIGLGVMLSQLDRNIKLSKGVVWAGWLTSLWAIIWCFWTPSHLALKNYQYDSAETAAYNAWASLSWSLALCWIIFACYTGNCGKLNKILGSKIMIALNKISYSIFLIEFLVFFYRIGTIRSSQQFQLSTSLFDWTEIALTIGAAILLAITFDLPFQKIKSIILAPSTETVITSLHKPEEEKHNHKHSNENLYEPDYVRDNVYEHIHGTNKTNENDHTTHENDEPEMDSPFGDDNIIDNYITKSTIISHDDENSIWEHVEQKPKVSVKKLWEDDDDGGFFGKDDERSASPDIWGKSDDVKHNSGPEDGDDEEEEEDNEEREIKKSPLLQNSRRWRRTVNDD